MITKGFDKSITVPASMSEPLEMAIGQQKLQLHRLADGKISLSFSMD